jgi:predicted lactoylglutathione lyase
MSDLSNSIFINLAVSNPARSVRFYEALGFKPYAPFTGGEQQCMTWGSQIYVMLQSGPMFQAHLQKQMPDMQKFQSASYTLPLSSAEEVSAVMQRGLEACGREPIPMIDEGYMQVRTIEDPDGHIWGIIHLDMERFQARKD